MIAPAVLVLAVLLPPGILLVRGGRGRGAYLRGTLHVASMLGFTLAGRLMVVSDAVEERLAFVLFGLLWSGFFWIASIRRRAESSFSQIPVAEEAEEARADEGAERLDREGRAFLERLLEMSRLRVGEISTPRDRIVYADCAEGLTGALARIRESGFLRVPMVDGSLDRIVGVVHAKEVVLVVLGGRPIPPLRSVMRRTFFISRDASAANLLELFRAQRGHLAVVVDEYNRTVGLVTRSDVFRHLAGGKGGAA